MVRRVEFQLQCKEATTMYDNDIVGHTMYDNELLRLEP